MKEDFMTFQERMVIRKVEAIGLKLSQARVSGDQQLVDQYELQLKILIFGVK